MAANVQTSNADAGTPRRSVLRRCRKAHRGRYEPGVRALVGPNFDLTETHTDNLWVYENGQMVNRETRYVPAIYRIFDAMLLYAADISGTTDPLHVDISAEKNAICVFTRCQAAVTQEVRTRCIWQIFGHLLSSSSSSSSECGGCREEDAGKLAQLLSSEFEIETTVDWSTESHHTSWDSRKGTKLLFVPNLQLFGMAGLDGDILALMKRRVVDLAGTLGTTVVLNKEVLPVKNFNDYVNLYLRTTPPKVPRVFHNKDGCTWQICVTQSNSGFQQVSFVNHVATTKGGSHVDYVTTKTVEYIMNKSAAVLEAQTVRNRLWVFLNCMIDNPSFDSQQTRETLTTQQSSFSSKCELSEEFLKRVYESGLGQIILPSLKNWRRVTWINGLVDAFKVGCSCSDKCTLILTDDESLGHGIAMAGISVLGRDNYGVYLLRRKLPNIEEIASPLKIPDNEEIGNIMTIIGLEPDKKYDGVDSLRYKHLMIIATQDEYGSRFKVQLIKLFYTYWPSLLKIGSFTSVLTTPIVKEPFLTSEDFEKHFNDIIGKYKADLTWEPKIDDYEMALAFGEKKETEERKKWLDMINSEVETTGRLASWEQKEMTYSKFVCKDLSVDLRQSIPSMVDGLRREQRKILFCSFKMNLVKPLPLSEFCGCVNDDDSPYHHSQAWASLESTIIGMAQNFVGSNNINLLMPIGPFGRRLMGGKDHAEARYLSTQLAPYTRYLFHEDDDGILLSFADDRVIGPAWYVPVIPLVLVNGADEIGTGWSCKVPPHDPRDIIENLRRFCEGEELKEMTPWIRGFRGDIKPNPQKKGTYYVNGKLRKEVAAGKVVIEELPVGRGWTEERYTDFLEKLVHEQVEAFSIESYEVLGEDGIHITMTPSQLAAAEDAEGGLLESFGLTSTITTDNMHLIGPDGLSVVTYPTTCDILTAYCRVRLDCYKKRKETLVKNMMAEEERTKQLIRFAEASRDLIWPWSPEQFIREGLPGEWAINPPPGALVKGFVEDQELKLKRLERERTLMGRKSAADLWKADLDALENIL